MTLPASFYIEICYLIATALFVLSLMWLSAPTTARRGVLAGEIGMILAVGGTLLEKGIMDLHWVIVALVIGSLIGIPLGLVQMTGCHSGRPSATRSVLAASRWSEL